MNLQNGKTFNRHKLLRNLSDKINLNISHKYVGLSNRSFYYT